MPYQLPRLLFYCIRAKIIQHNIAPVKLLEEQCKIDIYLQRTINMNSHCVLSNEEISDDLE